MDVDAFAVVFFVAYDDEVVGVAVEPGVGGEGPGGAFGGGFCGGVDFGGCFLRGFCVCGGGGGFEGWIWFSLDVGGLLLFWFWFWFWLWL